MGVIIPAILPTSRDDLEAKLGLLEGLVDTVQIDIVDGVFAEPPTWPYVNRMHRLQDLLMDGEMLPYLGRFHFELDMMIENPEQTAGLWIAAGAQRIVVHAESTRHMETLIEELSGKYGHEKDFVPGLLSLGLSIGNDTDVSQIEPYVEKIDYIQFMGIREIGKQAQPFDTRIVERVRSFRRAHPDITIQVDGAVSLETAPLLLQAGVDRLVVGSALWKGSSVREELAKFKDLLHEYGVYS